MTLSPVRRATALVFAAALLVTGCGDDDVDTDVGTTEQTEETSDTDPASDTATSEPVTDDGDTDGDVGQVIEISVVGGDVRGGGRHGVALGETVTIRVLSDTADHVHLHGYDVMVDVSPGHGAELTFTADIPGVFEVELEDSGTLLAELEIS